MERSASVNRSSSMSAVAHWGGFAAVLALIASTAQHSYVLFHSAVEILRMTVVFGIAALTWNSRREIDNPFILVIGLGFPALGVLTLLHTLAYKGMGVFQADANLPTQLWIALRAYESVLMLLAAGRVVRLGEASAGSLMLTFAAAGTALTWTVFSGLFPDCFVEGEGLTPFKIGAEYIIAGVFGMALLMVWRKRADFDEDILPLVLTALLSDIVAEMAFTQYISVYGPANLLGHLLVLTSTYCLYRAVFLHGIRNPQLLLFQQLSRDRDQLARNEADLTAKVAERTAELLQTNRRLAEELAERERAETAVHESQEKFRAIGTSAQDAIIMMDDDGCISYWNEAALHIFGYRENEALGRELHVLLAPERFLDSYRKGFARFKTSGDGAAVGKTLELQALRKGGQEFPIELSLSAVRLGGRMHAIGIIRDISERKQADAQLHRLNRAMRTISRCNEVLVHASNEDDLLNDMCRIIVEVGRHRLAWVGYVGETSLRCVAAFGIDGGAGPARAARAELERAAGPTAVALRDGIVCVVKDIADHPQPEPWRQHALALGFGAGIALPLSRDGMVFGALTIYAAERDAFDSKEEDLLLELADDLGYGIGALRTRVERDRAVKGLQLSAKVFEDSSEGILITDAEARIVAANRSFSRMTGYAEAEVIGCDPKLIKSDRHDAAFFSDVWAGLEESGHWMGEIWNRRKNGEVFPALESISAVRDESGAVTHYVAILADISSSKESEERIRFLTRHDPLTGLVNRGVLLDHLEGAVGEATRKERMVGVVAMNVDRFKVINDSLGHAAGDEVLKAIAGRLSTAIRHGDTVARLGGDEFVLLMADVAAADDVAALARNLQRSLALPIAVVGQEVVVTPSVGVALFPRDGEGAASLLTNAIAAMHRAKDLGGNAVQCYAPEMNARMLDRLELETALRRAVERREFVLHFQPKVELNRGLVIGAEALIRWRHPSRGMVPPCDFIPLAEQTGLIVPIGEWVIGAACAELRSWHEHGFSDLMVSVNVSGRQFQQENLVDVVAGALKTNGLHAQHLVLELTESTAMLDPDRTIEVLRRLKKVGVRISLDDFGTGYSSLSYLKRFPIDILKIDQSFVQDLTSDSENAAIASAVISLAHSLKHKVVAEGVETEAQCAFLRRQRCDKIQGFYFSRPLPADEFLQLLRDEKTLALGTLEERDDQRTLLLVDDEPHVLASLQRLFRRDGYRLLTAGSAHEAFKLLALNEVQVIVSDQRMPQMSGTEFLSRVKDLYPASVRIVLSGYTELQSITDAINRGAIYKFFTKPWDDELLREHVREAFLFHESKREQRQAETGSVDPRN